MTRTRFVTTSSARFSMELEADDGETIEEVLRRKIRLLDGERYFALNLWELPDGVDLPDVDLDEHPNDYIQCAGSASKQLACEIRENSRQYVLGRPDSGAEQPGEVTIPYADQSQVVRDDQALTADEVADCFIAYFHTRREPPGFTRTEIQL